MSFAPESPKANNWAKASEGTGKPWCRLRLPDSDWNLHKKNKADYKPIDTFDLQNEFNWTFNTGGPARGARLCSPTSRITVRLSRVALLCQSGWIGPKRSHKFCAETVLQWPHLSDQEDILWFLTCRVLDDGPMVFPWLLLSLAKYVSHLGLKLLNLERFFKMVTPNHAPSLAKAAPPAVCPPRVYNRSAYRWSACCPLLLARSLRHPCHGTPHECGCWQLRSSHHVPGSVWDSRFDTSNRWHTTSHLRVTLVQRQSSARPLPVAARLNSQAAPRRNR